MKKPVGLALLLWFSLTLPSLGLGSVAPITVFLGGFGSCTQGYLHGHHAGPNGIGLLDRYEALLDELQKTPSGVPQDIAGSTLIAGCFTYNFTYPGELRLAVVKRAKGNHFRIVGHETVETYSVVNRRLEFKNTGLRQLIEELSLKDDDEHPVTIIGHSYGGDLTLRTVLALDKSVPIENVVTIDPINMADCRINEVTEERTSLLFGTIPAVIKGCTQAPSEITRDDQKDILSRTENHWYHFYQTLNARLHSGTFSEVEALGQSYQIKEGLPQTTAQAFTMPGMMTAHGLLAGHKLVWKRIRELLTR